MNFKLTLAFEWIGKLSESLKINYNFMLKEGGGKNITFHSFKKMN